MSIVAVIDRVESHFQDSTTHYESGSYENGVNALLHVLDDVLRFAEAREARQVAGAGLESSYAPKDW